MEEGRKSAQKGGGKSSFGGGGGRVNKARHRGNRGSSSAGKKFFRCSVCSYVTNVKARFTKHVKYHSMPGIFCQFCDFSTPYKWNLDRHQKNHNGGGELHCHLCNFTADIKQSLTVHVQNHHASILKNTTQPVNVNVTMDVDDVCNQNQMMDNENNMEMEGEEDEEDEEEDEDVHQQQLQLDVVVEHKSNGSATPPELGAKQHQQGVVVRRQSIGPKEEVDEGFLQKSSFLQSLALKPNVLYSIDDHTQVLPTPPKLTTPKSSPPGRRLSMTTTMTEASPNRKFLGTTVKKSREKRLLLEELAQKLVAASKSEENSSTMCKNSVTITSNSTRCQFCRQRCKTSTDLALHLTMCSEALSRASDDGSNSNDKLMTTMSENFVVPKQPQDVPNSSNNNNSDQVEGCTSENKIFVWNNYPYAEAEEEEEDIEGDEETEDVSMNDGESQFLDDLVGFETSPGIGAIHMGKLEEIEYEGYGGELDGQFDGQGSVTTTRKVYRCPQPNCGFWATTASRFHVHIVGHFNMKPFECSQCSYKSNWRWDITKHIKLKALRDINHTKAKILLTHESGQRNYRKYDRYLIMMQLKHSASSKLPDCSTVASKRTDVTLSPPPANVSSPKVSPGAKSNTCVNLTMPKLTRAPMASNSSRAPSPATSVKSEESGSGARPRPPPALVPISSSSSSTLTTTTTNAAPSEGRTIVEKKMLSGGHILLSAENQSPAGLDLYSEECEVGPNKRARTEGNLKKILWKCKKCSFRHASKEIVVFHIRQYHKPKSGESVSILSPNLFLPSLPQDEASSQSLKEPMRRKSTASIPSVKETHQYQYFEDEAEYRCKFCPFRVDTLQVMEAHAENHFSKPNCQFSCPHCSFSVQTRRELLEHVPIHASTNGAMNDERAENLKITAEETPPKPRGSLTSGGSAHKKYHCTECPYVTDSKGQFLYHKQFHRPRDCPFRCSHCSYTVSHKHLLHQHLRVHGLPPLSPPLGQLGSGFLMVNEDGSIPNMDDQPLNLHQSSSNNTNKDSDGPPLLDEVHPTVLVDGYGRMYRCKHCPQVYGKISDLNEHEMSHESQGSLNESPQQNLTMSPNFSDSNSSSQGKSLHCCEACPARFFHEKELEIHTSFHQSKSEFQCHLCSYSAKQQNPHLLSHMKVHGMDYQMKTQQLLMRYPRASPPAAKIRKKPVTAKNLSLNIPQVNQFISNNIINNSNTFSVSSSSTATVQKTAILCQKCPAKFYSKNAYQQHITFHGRDSVFKCRHCDYGVETLKNLTLHELLHAGSSELVTPEFNTFGPTINNHKARSSTTSLISPPLNDGSIDENAYIGNPEFTYPTYVKNGRIKEKRYKCSKCPSAFEKRDQYKVHTGLHGSDQRYKCAVCDYAVTYYANFIQHLKKHANQPDIPAELLVAKPFSKMKGEGTGKRNSVPKSLPADAVTTTTGSLDNNNKKALSCPSCPFTTLDKNIFEDHKTHHIPAKKPGNFQCSYCDYTTSKKNSLKQHIRLHFFVPAEQLDSYMYAKDVNVFVDAGNYDEKIYSEKENYDDDNDKDESGTGVVTFVDIKKCLPVPMQEEVDEEVESEEEHNFSALEPIDCTM